jgi:hypothetical protein
MTTTEHADQPAEVPSTTAKPALVFPKMWLLFGVLICCFTAWGVAADLTTPMVAGFKRIFDMSTFQASLVQLAYFGGPLIGQQAAQPGRLHVVVSGHAAPQCALAVHYLVVADRQHEVLAEGIQHREGDLVVVVAAVYRISLDELQCVVHPAHVPLHRKTKPAKVGRTRHARP